MTLEQMLTITKLLNQIEPASIDRVTTGDWVLYFDDDDKKIMILPTGCQVWLLHNKYHRTDGPAIVYADGTQRWCFNNQIVSKEEHARRMTR